MSYMVIAKTVWRGGGGGGGGQMGNAPGVAGINVQYIRLVWVANICSTCLIPTRVMGD